MAMVKIIRAFGLIMILLLQITVPATAGVERIHPSEACNLLKSIGLPTTGWRLYYDDECGCSSRAKSIGAGNPYKNQISYSVEGKGKTVRQLRLIMNILNPEEAESAHAEFQYAVKLLIEKIISQPAPGSIFRAIANGTDMVLRINDVLIEVVRKEWTMNTDLGGGQYYDVRLVIH